MVKLGIVGTSWWTDSMYLPALENHPHVEVQAICGRNADRAKSMADQWNIECAYTSFEEFLDSGIEAVIIASSNDTHYDMAMQALHKGLHVLCEKPIALCHEQALEMSNLAKSKGVKHMTPFTYSYMPTARYIKELIDTGYIGQPYHLNMRYYTGFGRSSEYLWRFNTEKAGSGAAGDIGSHFIYIAMMMYGDVTGVFAKLGRQQERPPVDPEGAAYTIADDSAIIVLEFENGALGNIHVSTLANEETPFGQIHQMEFHGSKGSLHSYSDWDKVQQVSGSQVGTGPTRPLEIPEHIWSGVRQDTVHNTYKDVFRTQDVMARAFITDIVEDRQCKPDFEDGEKVQQILDAIVRSDSVGGWQRI